VNANPGSSLRLLLYAGLVLVTACSVTRDGARMDGGDGSRCGENGESCNVVGGYSGNVMAAGVTGGTISGGGRRSAPNQVTADNGTVGGGEGNIAGEGSTVAGGSWNTAQYFHATVGGGANNIASAEEATVGGGLKNVANERFATVGGGAVNIASDLNSTVAGGSGNTASARFTTVGGGTHNAADTVAAVVSGGDHNQAQGAYSSILGGVNNTADGYLATIGGGAGNHASGAYAAIAGGFANVAAGDYSFAAGNEANVSEGHPGAFLFADSSPFPFTSMVPNEFAVRATGGVRFVTGADSSGARLAGVRLSPGSGAWESLSDANAKAGLAAVDGSRILEELMSMPIETWYYRAQDPSIRHVGPTAQDFRAAFQLGQDDQYISTVDEEGVALAAIQELYRIVQQGNPGLGAARAEELAQAKQIESLERRLALSNGLAVGSLLIALLALWRRASTAP
jgi:hypothetical protein